MPPIASFHPAPVRLRAPRVTPLEVWQLVLNTNVTLSRAIRHRPERLLEGLTLLHRGEGRTRSGHSGHHACAGYRHLVIGGGRSVVVSDAVLSQGPTPFTRLPDTFIGEPGGLALAAAAGFHADETLVIDLGQTSIKASYAGQRCRLERDLGRLPRGRVPSRQRPAQRTALRDFLAEAIRDVTAGRCEPAAAIFALPGEVGPDASPGRSSYAGTTGYTGLLSESLRCVDLKPKMVGVLNDAELAAVSAGLLPEAAGKTLVLTLGFGLGAALLSDTRTQP